MLLMISTYNEPLIITREHYDTVIENYIQRIKDIPHLISIYQMGSINTPGLSDIDLIIVVEDDVSDEALQAFSVADFDQNVFLHVPAIIPLSLAPQLQYIIYASNLVLLWGSETLFGFESLSEREKKHLSACYLVEFLESRLYQIASSANRLNKRLWLTRVWSVLHSCDLFETYFSPLTEQEKERIGQILRTREQWNLEHYVSDSVFLQAFQANKFLTAQIFNKVLYSLYEKPLLEKTSCFFDGERLFCFLSKDQLEIPEYQRKVIPILGRQITLSKGLFPGRFLAHVSHYRKDWDVRWTHPPTFDLDRKAIMETRFLAVQTHQSWLIKNHCSAHSLKGYLGVTSLANMEFKHQMKYALSKILLR